MEIRELKISANASGGTAAAGAKILPNNITVQLGEKNWIWIMRMQRQRLCSTVQALSFVQRRQRIFFYFNRRHSKQDIRLCAMNILIKKPFAVPFSVILRRKYCG